MPKVTNTSNKVKGCRKCGRNKRKEARKGSPESLYSRGLISGEAYFKLTNQKVRN